MSRYVLTEPEMEALKAAFEVGSEGLPDDRWVAVQVALMQPPPAGRDAVEIDLDEVADEDLRSAFTVGYEGFSEDGVSHAAMAGALADVAQMLNVAPSRSYGM